MKAIKNCKAIALSALMSAMSFSAMAQTPVYMDANQPIEERVNDALSRMTLEEKIAIIHAQSKFCSPGVPRLGIPENWMTDGPHGIRAEVMWDEWYGANWTNDSCTAYPALTCLAATWNPEMSFLYGKRIGEEARYRNKNVLLGPGVNIYRTPLNGRNFEYMGEDPYLASTMVVPYIKGVQEIHVAACVKHFALNNQETRRDHINVEVDDRTLYEIYLPAFKAAVQEGGAWAIMGAYNQYKGEHCCHNQYLLNDILRKEWGFNGVVISDWGGVHDTEQAIKNGLDMEFGSWTNGLDWGASNAYDNYFMAHPYLKMIQEGKVCDKELNEKVRNVLRLVFRTNMDKTRSFGSFASQQHALAGRTIAQEGIVLLKNKGNVLPLDVNKHKRILVVGENAVKRMTIGGGSSSLKVKKEVSPLEGIRARVGNAATVTYVDGYKSQAVKEQDVLNAKTPEQEVIDLKKMREEAVAAAKEADVVIFIGGLNKNEHQDCEGTDRETLSLPYEQDELVKALVAANPNTVVSIISGNAVAMPWVKEVPAIVEAWFGGSEAGNALASVLFGDVNPSGKLPFTYYASLNQCNAHVTGEFPGDEKTVKYNDGIFVGYRYIDRKKLKPLFAFGHGLSYTTFEYGKPVADKKTMSENETLTITVPVTNTGAREGKEVVQLYVRDVKSSVVRPIKELKAFSKVALRPGETKKVELTIAKDALSYFDADKHEWVAEPGKFEAWIGSASDDIRRKVAFELK